MLGSLARKLRIFGFDAAYFRDGPDSNLQLMARREGRMMITSDVRLAKEAASNGLGVFLLRGSNDRERLRRLVELAATGSVALEPGMSRCATCNGSLVKASRAELGPRIPEGVGKRHRQYFLCRDCGKVYWKGGHWSRLRSLSLVLGGSSRKRPGVQGARRPDPQ